MTHFRPLLVLAVTFALLAVPSSAWAKAKKKKGGGAVGVVEQVQEGTLTVKIMGKKKKGAAPAEGVTKTFALTKETKIEKVVGKKKNQTTLPATLVDLKAGERVVVVAAGDKAETVKIVEAKKKKKKKNV